MQHFGASRVRAALEKTSSAPQQAAQKPRYSNVSRKVNGSSIAHLLESIQETDTIKSDLLNPFYQSLLNRNILPKSEDIRHFATIIGLKFIDGKSRRDLVPKLMRFLLELTNEQLEIDLPQASNISEEQRQKSYSLLTDKILGK